MGYGMLPAYNLLPMTFEETSGETVAEHVIIKNRPCWWGD